MNIRNILSAFAIFTLGVLAAKMIPAALIPAAQAGAGGWQCYVVDRMPDMKAAAEWKGAVAYTTGLNEVASGSPVGTVINANYPTAGGMYGSGSSGAPILCVKN